MASGKISAEDAIPQEWDLSYPVSLERLSGTRLSHYIPDLVELFKSGLYGDGIPLDGFISTANSVLSSPERLHGNELLALLRRGILFDMPEEDAGYPSSFYDFRGMIFSLCDDSQIRPWKSLVFSMREHELGRAVSRLVPEGRFSEKGLDWLLNASGADEDSAAGSYALLEELGLKRQSMGPNVELLGIGAETLDKRRRSLEYFVGMDLQKTLQSPRVLLRSPRQIDGSRNALHDFGLDAEEILQSCGLLAVSEEYLREKNGFLSAGNPEAGSDPALLKMHPETLGERLEYLTMNAGMDDRTVWSNYELLHMSRKSLHEKTRFIYSNALGYGALKDKAIRFARENSGLWLRPMDELRKELAPRKRSGKKAGNGRKNGLHAAGQAAQPGKVPEAGHGTLNHFYSGSLPDSDYANHRGAEPEVSKYAPNGALPESSGTPDKAGVSGISYEKLIPDLPEDLKPLIRSPEAHYGKLAPV